MNDTQSTIINNSRKTLTRLGQEQLTELAAAIECAPPAPRRLTAREALSALVPQIREALNRGHTTNSIAATITANGLSVSARSVASALRDSNANATTSPSRKPRGMQKERAKPVSAQI